MNEIDNKLPEIITDACHFVMLEYEINQILKEFNCETKVNEPGEKTIDYIYNKLSVLHNQVKAMKIMKNNIEIEKILVQRRLFESQKKNFEVGSQKKSNRYNFIFDGYSDNEDEGEGEKSDDSKKPINDKPDEMDVIDFSAFPSFISQVPNTLDDERNLRNKVSDDECKSQKIKNTNFNIDDFL